MKRILIFFLSTLIIFSSISYNVSAESKEDSVPYIVDFTLTPYDNMKDINENIKASDLIIMYDLSLSRTGTILNITGNTSCVANVVKCGFKDLMVQRRKTSSDSWKDYFDIGDAFANAIAANLDMNVSVAAGYQYRVTCKHYAKKSLLSVETVPNVSNIVSTPS